MLPHISCYVANPFMRFHEFGPNLQITFHYILYIHYIFNIFIILFNNCVYNYIISYMVILYSFIIYYIILTKRPFVILGQDLQHMSLEGRDRDVQFVALIQSLNCANTSPNQTLKSHVLNFNFTHNKESCPRIVFGGTSNKDDKKFISCAKLHSANICLSIRRIVYIRVGFRRIAAWVGLPCPLPIPIQLPPSTPDLMLQLCFKGQS